MLNYIIEYIYDYRQEIYGGAKRHHRAQSLKMALARERMESTDTTLSPDLLGLSTKPETKVQAHG